MSSSITPLRRFSKSPLYFVPAKRAPKSRANNSAFLRISGTVPATILSAKPSAIAVLPTPASPTRIGLFFFLLHKTCTTLVISAALPITGSILPSFALSNKLIEYFARKLSFSSSSSSSLCVLVCEMTSKTSSLDI